MRTPEEIQGKLKKHLIKYWKRNLLDSMIDGASWDISYDLSYAKEDAIQNIHSYERYRRTWEKALEPLEGDGFELVEKSVNWGAAGGIRTVLKGIRFYSLETAIEFAGGQELLDLWHRTRNRLVKLEEEGRSRKFISRLAEEKSLLADEKDFELNRLITIVDFLATHQNLNCYIREIPAPGIDTKFFEKYKRVVVDLLSIQLDKPILVNDLKTKWMIKDLPFAIEVRHAHNFFESIPKDLPVGLPLESLSREPRALVVIENRQTGLSVKEIPEDVAIAMGMGFSVVRLNEIPWIRKVPVFYFGDLDHHGLQILSHFRQVVPQTKSVLMDLETLNRFVDFSIPDPTQPKTKHAPITLNEEEAKLYDTLVEKGLRLEQERIPLEVIDAAFASAFKNLT